MIWSDEAMPFCSLAEHLEEHQAGHCQAAGELDLVCRHDRGNVSAGRAMLCCVWLDYGIFHHNLKDTSISQRAA